MRLLLPCLECCKLQSAADPPSPGHPKRFAYMPNRVDLEGAAVRIECHQGHETTLRVGVHQYELLFESGAMALLDGYYREAVSSFAVSWERFLEHWVHATLLQDGATATAVLEMWKDMSRQSERQRGAFVALYFAKRGRLPSLPGQNDAQFRNDVVHRGKFPRREEATAFARTVYDLIAEHTLDLQAAAADGILRLTIALQEPPAASNTAPAPTLPPMFMMTILGGGIGRPGATFDSELEELRERHQQDSLLAAALGFVGS